MRLIDADKVLEYLAISMDMQDLYLPAHFLEFVIDEMPTEDAVPVGIINEMIDRYQDYLDEVENGDDGWADTCVKSMTALQTLLTLWAERKEE